MTTPWTPEEIERTLAILARHKRVDAALVEIQRGVRPIGARRLRDVLAEAGEGPPSSYLAPEGHGRVIPAGQRLRGVSTLTDADGATEREWVKTERASDDPPAHDVTPPDFAITSVSTMLDGQGQARVQWVRSEREKADQMAAFEAACASVAAKFVGLAPAVPAPKFTSLDWLSGYLFGDPHVGMLAQAVETGNDNHDLKIGIGDLEVGVDLAVEAAPPSHVGLLVNLGDYYHAENDKQVTPMHGHKLDVDGRRSKVFRAGTELIVHAILRMLEKHAEVWFDCRPGNHDPVSADMLAIFVEAYFRNEPRVKVLQTANPYNVVEWGKNLILTSHGNYAKREALPGLAAARYPEIWGRTRYRVAYGGHVHHESRKEFPGMVVETFQTLVAPDAHTAWSGYDSGRSLSVISHHKEFGPKMRSVIDIAQIRAVKGAL